MSVRNGLRGGRWAATPPSGITIVPDICGGDYYSGPEFDGNDEGESFFTEEITFPCFARPCPTTPRHGFVESQRVFTTTQLLNLLAETLRADPGGEMIVMPWYTGKYSAVANNAGIVWGYGNAGVTSGVGGGENTSRFIPVQLGVGVWARKTTRASAGVTECPYVELVEDQGRVRIVQVRDGPAQAKAQGRYVPRALVVEHTISPGDVSHDLLRWDKLVRGARCGTVAVLGAGLTRFSHFAVHCLTNRVPIVFGEAPAIGTKLAPSAEPPLAPFTQADHEYISRIIMGRLLAPEAIKELGVAGAADQNRVLTAIGTCHAMLGWGPEPHLLRLCAEGIVACFRYSATACLGEIRHFYRVGPGSRPGIKLTTDMQLALGQEAYAQFKTEKCISRNLTYTAVSLLPPRVQIKLLIQARADFNRAGWHQAFGGPSWAEAAKQTAWLGRSIISFCAKPNAGRWRRLQFRYNATLHACHNNGKVLTKWVPGAALTNGAAAPTLCFMNAFVAETLLFAAEPAPFAGLKSDFERKLNNDS